MAPGDRLGICEKWPGYPYTPPDFGQVCDPEDQTSCTDPPNVPYGNNMCFPWGYNPDGGSDFKPAYECYVETDNTLASTDGPEAGGDCFGSGVNSFRADVWYTMTAPCYGKAIIDMCTAPAEYDSMLAVFGDHTDSPSCPRTHGDNLDLLYCNDDYCMGAYTLSGITWDTYYGATYILRLGGYSSTGADADAAQGLSRMHIGCYSAPCICYESPALPADDEHRVLKNRYLSIDPNTNPTRDIVLKVEVAEMRRCQNAPTRACMTDTDCDDVCDDIAGDPPYHTLICPPYDCSATVPPSTCIWSGPCVDLAPTFDPPLAWVVQQPMQDPTGGCKKPGCPPYPEPPAPQNCCEDDDWMAYLGPEVPDLGPSNTWAEVWADLPAGVLHITGCAVVPATTYAIYACNPSNLDEGSEPLMVATGGFPHNERPISFGLYADICGGAVGPGPTVLPPDGYVGVKDLQISQITLINYGSEEQPQAHPTWVDMHGLGQGILPDCNLNVSDFMAVYVMSLMNSHPYVNTQGGLDPQDCP